ncbi:MAG: tRNA uracil 4-sulfurtransferase ThiI [Christensenellales bacterium]
MKIILLRYGELYLKGENQKLFIKALISNIKTALHGLEYKLERAQARLFVKTTEDHLKAVMKKLENVFGLSSYSVVEEVQADKDVIEEFVGQITTNKKTFRVNVKRADKSFPVKSIEFERHLGGIVLKNNPNLKVDLTKPEFVVNIDIRENKKAYIYFDSIPGAGGLPLGTAGKGLLLLSGGIDSPVAGYQIAKRGLAFEGLHFHSYPYTSDQAKQKVISLAKLMNNFNPNFKVHFVSITKLQEEINKNCKSDYMITIMRRFMFRIAEEIAQRRGLKAIITGENLAQVASQTVESLTSTNSVLKNVIAFRPLLTFDKEEIIQIANKIGTYETSILPYEDCCTVFLPKTPIIKPKIERIVYEENKLDLESLLQESLSSLETISINELI